MVGAVVLPVIGSVVAAVATLVSSLIWAVAITAGIGAVSWAGLALTREVLAYRADKRDERWVLAQLAARGIPAPPTAGSIRPGPTRLSMTRVARPVLPTGGVMHGE